MTYYREDLDDMQWVDFESNGDGKLYKGSLYTRVQPELASPQEDDDDIILSYVPWSSEGVSEPGCVI